jgi:hypothetical protein
MSKAKPFHPEDMVYDHDGEFDFEATLENHVGNRDGRVEYITPGAQTKWRARNLVDIHWKLVGAELQPPAETYNRIMSCIIDHANPVNGVCYPKQGILAIETGYSEDTVQRAVKWWVKNKFLVTEGRGIARSLAYHPQWRLLEEFYIAVLTDIKEQKEAASRTVRHAEPHQGAVREPHHGAVPEPQSITSKKEPHPERRPSAMVSSVKDKKEGIQRGEVEGSSTNPDLPECLSYDEGCTIVSGYCEPFHWANLTEEDFDAAVVAELRESGAGRAVAHELALQRAKEKGSAADD